MCKREQLPNLFEIPGTDGLSCIVKYSSRALRFRITINQDGSIVLTYPMNAKIEDAFLFLEKNAGWILRTKHNLENEKELAASKDTSNSSEYPASLLIPIISSQPLLIHYKEEDHFWIAVRLSNDEKSIEVTGKITDVSNVYRALAQFIISYANPVFNQRLFSISQKMGEQFLYEHLSVRIQKSKWGSCTSKRNISLNACLLFFEPELIDYIMIHELCHLVEMNHSERFYKLLSDFCPNWKTYKSMIQEESKKIPRFLQTIK